MDLIYKIYDVLLYDNQIDHDFIIPYNKRHTFHGETTNDLPYEATLALREIYNLPKSEHFLDESVKVFEKYLKKSGLSLIKNDEFLTSVKGRKTHLSNYNAYDILWNETKSGINLFDYDLCAVWKKGSSQYSVYRVNEYVECRRDSILKLLIS